MLHHQSQHLPGAGNMTQQGWRRIAQSSTGGNDTSFTKANVGGGRGGHKSVLPGALGKSVYYSGCWWLHLTSGCHWETTAKGKQWGYVQGWRGHAVWWEEIGRVKRLPFDLLSEKAETRGWQVMAVSVARKLCAWPCALLPCSHWHGRSGTPCFCTLHSRLQTAATWLLLGHLPAGNLWVI